MLNRMIIKYIKEISFDKREKRDQIKNTLRMKFLESCDKNGVENTINSYRQYRAVVRSIYGFDLISQRPKKKHNIVETYIELF